MKDLVAFIETRLEEDERVAMAASSEYSRPATVAEHWRWACTEDDQPVDPDLAIASGQEFLGHGDDHIRAGLRSIEAYPSIVGPLLHLVIDGEEVTPQVARHLARFDPARVLRDVAAKRAVITRYERAAALPESTSGFVRGQDDGYQQACLDAVKDAAAVWSDHPEYRQEWKT